MTVILKSTPPRSPLLPPKSDLTVGLNPATNQITLFEPKNLRSPCVELPTSFLLGEAQRVAKLVTFGVLERNYSLFRLA